MKAFKRLIAALLVTLVIISFGSFAYAENIGASGYKHYEVLSCDNNGVWNPDDFEKDENSDYHFTFDGPFDQWHNVSLFCDDVRMKNYGKDWKVIGWNGYYFTVSGEFMSSLEKGTHHFTVYYVDDDYSRGGFDVKIK